MADFYQFLPALLRNEGGWVDDPIDPGGATNKGVTFGTFKIYAERVLGIEPSLQNLRRLSNDQAGRIYKAEYWDALRGDDIAHQLLANIVFDFYVNAGGHATNILLKVLNHAGANLHGTVRITPKVIEVMNKMDLADIYMEYKHARISYYRNLAHEHPPLRKFLRGWLNRVNTFPDIPTSSHSAANSNAVCAKK
ncbi:glycosyl hydrolase 108 family protein [Undibacterium cyanobacteriorum]|uniref:Glycosyl hydrolase 108 family protein n=1 Tax=Undibacterium cyanobacteriorum TaxID=3073561 RepID=A0ABY9RKZ0_9BURK|nr:glycosyl hydrolase 108 family protein [Undibacterium sp. 20NA77.5]WMW80935.1 glycosyl hydrolase 108 family protein [Undibacterium sp. 20NA77.5]